MTPGSRSTSRTDSPVWARFLCTDRMEGVRGPVLHVVISSVMTARESQR